MPRRRTVRRRWRGRVVITAVLLPGGRGVRRRVDGAGSSPAARQVDEAVEAEALEAAEPAGCGRAGCAGARRARTPGRAAAARPRRAPAARARAPRAGRGARRGSGARRAVQASAARPSTTAEPWVVRPRPRSRWAMWSPPPRSSGRPARWRETRTSRVSVSTTAVSAKSSAVVCSPGAPACTATADEASRNPVNRAPQSPRWMRAGCQLCSRKPVRAAASTLSSSPCPGWPSAIAHTARPSAVTAATAPITPSRVSRSWKALVTKTIHSTASAPASGGEPGEGDHRDRGRGLRHQA